MSEVHSLQLAGFGLETVLLSYRPLGRKSLELVGQGIVVPSIFIVEETSHLAHKIHRGQGQIPLDHIGASDFTRCPGNLTHPIARVKIPKTPRRVLYVRLEMKDRIPILSQP